VDRFLGVGDLESARKIRSQTARTFGNLNNAYLIINTAIFLKTDVSKIDIEKLYKLSLSNNALSYEAMIKLIEALIAREQEIDDNILDALEKMAFETQNSQTGFNIQVAQINALFVTGRIAKAMDIFDELRVISNVSPSVFQFIFDHIVTLSLRQKNDAIFLNFILNFSEKMIIEDEDLNFKIATRLVDLGLYQNARKFISQSNGKYSQEQRILLGKSYVMNGQGNLAIEHLQGVTDSEANFLLARAYEQVGDFSKAASSLLELGDVQGQRRLALQARNWEALADIGSEEQSSAASFFLKENELDNSISNNLNGDEFLKRSKQAREIIQNLIK
jgi:hypothetical protein